MGARHLCIALRLCIERASRSLESSIKGGCASGLLVVRLGRLGHARIGKLAPRIELGARPVVMGGIIWQISDLPICHGGFPRPKPLDQRLLEHVSDLVDTSCV